jgi:hypothetical protein
MRLIRSQFFTGWLLALRQLFAFQEVTLKRAHKIKDMSNQLFMLLTISSESVRIITFL